VREEIVPGPPVGATPELTVTVPEQEPIQSRLLVVLWLLVVGAGLAALVAAMIPVGPAWLDGAGAVAVVTAYSWALAARTGGRPVVFGALALALGGAVLAVDQDYLRTGAAVMTCVVSAVLGVMATTPAVQFARAARECVIAVLVAGVGALATIGFDPVVSVVRYDTFEDGLRRLGDTPYGLQAGIYTRDIDKAFAAIRSLDMGGVLINDTPIFRVDHMPYGGNRRSGIGREGVRYAVEEMTNLRMVVVNLT